MHMIELKNIENLYGCSGNKTLALNGISLEVKKGECLSIFGPSGSGKSTLLNILGLLDVPDNGEYSLNGKRMSGENKMHQARNQMIGFIFQNFALLKDYTILENVVLPLNYRRMPQKERNSKAVAWLEKVGLKEHIHKKPDELSGGQQQRAAIARALIGDPELILADEPTGNLDRQTSDDIMRLLVQLNREGKTMIIATHNIDIAKKCDRVIEIADGSVVDFNTIERERLSFRRPQVSSGDK
ncbi:ABC transporter ATP-binding protein [Bacillus sp. FJAT-42376]|uniref:ABC transporter ATP-binding protein n=1 Tax=Bacillus sp. FJAT-42376 TaxID=2014076 RepID=UPI000F4F3094|nr:ABC transporter ATP-binding protein [Bacillus sp. FJAT-42376]AZB41559.1 ABC transporter ATP-binding protein [Bacillus sp. FJAT-42376]